MADALCGPSNPLQSFQKYTQTDRTLQQDRFSSSRNSPAQGFRSQDPRAGSLDADFHAFESAVPSPFHFEQRPAFEQLNQGPVIQQPSTNWASDFQRLHISQQPIPSHQFRTEAPLVRSAPGGWQQEFMRQRENASPAQKSYSPDSSVRQLSQVNPMYPGTLMGQTAFSQPSVYNPLQNSSQEGMQQEAGTRNLDFEKQFEDAFAQLDKEMLQQDQLKQSEEFSASSKLEEDQSIYQPSNTKIGSDAIKYTEVPDRSVDQNTRDANELARVAGELIQNVSHETDAKFQNSQFLDLMRRIRDREIEVRNNDFESTSQPQQPEKMVSTIPEENATLQSHDPNTFEFPNMDNVYRPEPDIPQDYSFDSDQYPAAPRTQMTDLHPGGPYYPERSPPPTAYAQMSGAVNEGDRVKPNEHTGYETFTPPPRDTRNQESSPVLQDARSKKWVAWPAAHTKSGLADGEKAGEEAASNKLSIAETRYTDWESEAGDAWRGAIAYRADV